MYVTRIPNRNSPPAVLLRESYREGGKVSRAPSPTSRTGLRPRSRAFDGCSLGNSCAARSRALQIARALAHGHVAAVLGTVRRLGLDKMLPKGPERRAKLILAMIVARIVEPAAKLATARQLTRRPPPTRSAPCSASARSTRTNSTPPSTFWAAPGERREGPRSAPSQGRRARALRRHLELPRRAALRAGAVRLQPRPSRRPAADRLRSFMHAGRLSGRRRGVRGQSRRPDHARPSGQEATHALPAEAHRARRRPRHDHQGAHRRRSRARRLRLDHRAARPGDQGARGRGRPLAALAVRRARHGGDRFGRLSGRAPNRLPQPGTRRRARSQARRTPRVRPRRR